LSNKYNKNKGVTITLFLLYMIYDSRKKIETDRMDKERMRRTRISTQSFFGIYQHTMASVSFMNDYAPSYVLHRQYANTDGFSPRATDIPVAIPDLRMVYQYTDEPFTPLLMRHRLPAAPLMQRHVANTDAILPRATDVPPVNLADAFEDEEDEDDAPLTEVTLVDGVYHHDPTRCMNLIERYAPAYLPTEEFWSMMEEAVAYCIVQPTDAIGTTYLIDDAEEIGIREGCDLRLQTVLRLEERINDEICIWTRHIYAGYPWSDFFECDVDARPNARSI